MEIPKDNFSNQASLYARYRPTYPAALCSFLNSVVEKKQAAWDCGTGNGQVAMALSKYFEKVYATDISEQQIENAVKKANIFYSVERAEHSLFEDSSFDLITVAQAIHWFKFDDFYKEVIRTLRPNGILAIMGYGLMRADEDTDKIIDHFYYNIIGSFWDKERKYVEENYQTIPFPFKEIQVPVLRHTLEWTMEELLGYLETWSAVQYYIKSHNHNPVEQIKTQLQKIWAPGTTKTVEFPILLRVARVDKSSIQKL
ncbi:MAG: class I SAM-dependent methyltransferase [Ferruginibacter sp.]|nr:class I SAM-dependent methyltransferase [Ferruginibacter sp.]